MTKRCLKLLEFLKSKRTNNITIKVDELRELLLDDLSTYPQFSNFKQSILIPLVNEINEESDRDIKITNEVKRGAKIVEVSFFIKKKEKQVKSQTMTVVKGCLNDFLSELKDLESSDCIARIKDSIEKINEIVDNMSFMEYCKDLAEGYVDEYLTDGAYKENMEQHSENMREAVDLIESLLENSNCILEFIDALADKSRLNDIIDRLEL